MCHIDNTSRKSLENALSKIHCHCDVVNRFHHQVVLVILQVAPQHVTDQLDALRDV